MVGHRAKDGTVVLAQRQRGKELKVLNKDGHRKPPPAECSQQTGCQWEEASHKRIRFWIKSNLKTRTKHQSLCLVKTYMSLRIQFTFLPR